MNYKGLKRITLENAHSDGGNIEVEHGLIFEAEAEHSEITRALKIGAIETIEVVGSPAVSQVVEITTLVPKRKKDGEQ